MHAFELNLLGYLAALLVFSTFCMRTMIPLRIVAIASNAVFVAYAIEGSLWPILILHGGLLPLNVYRLFEIRRMLKQVEQARNAALDPAPLLAALTRKKYGAGAPIFQKGEPADCAYYIGRGTVRIPELGVHLHEGDLFGELGIFSGARQRTASAIGETEVELYRIAENDIVTALYQHPALAFSLIKLVASRHAENVAALQGQLERLQPRPVTAP